MKTIHIKQIAAILLATMLITSCKVTQEYSRPAVQTDSLYRGVSTKDTNNIFSISYTQLFADQNLQALLQEGISNNYDLKIAVARIKQSEAVFIQSKAAFLPTLSGTNEAGVQGLSVAQGRKLTSQNGIYEKTFSSSWELDVWGKLRSAKRAAAAQLLESDAYRRVVQTQLVADIATDYYSLLALDKQLQITTQTVENRKQDVEINKALKDASKVTGAAVVQSEANRYAAEVTIPDLQNSIRQTENALSVLLGRRPGSIARTSMDEQQIDTTLQTGVPAQLLSNRPDVAQAEYALRYYFEQTNIARAYFYPSLTITGTGGWQSATTKTVFNATSLFGSAVGGLTQPIFNQGLNKERLHVAKAQYEEYAATFQKTVLSAGEEVSDALYNYQSAKDKAGVRGLQLASLQKSVDYTKELLKYGYASSYADVLTSEQNYLAAQLNSVDDRLQQLTAVVSLYRSLGGGWK